MTWQLRLSYSYWRHHLWWLIGSVLSVAVTVGLAFVVTHFWLETNHTYTHMVEKPLGIADAHILAKDDEGMYAAWRTVLEALPDLETVTPVLSRQTVAMYEGASASVQVRGIEPETSLSLHPVRLLEGRMLKGDDTTFILVSSTLAKELGIDLNETLELVTPQGPRTYTVVGIADEDSSVVTAPLRDIQKLFTSGEMVDGFDVRFAPSTNQMLALQTLQERLKSEATVLTKSERVRSVRDVFTAVHIVLVSVFAFSFTMMTCLLFGLLETSRSERQDEIRALYVLGVSPASLLSWRRLELGGLLVMASGIGILAATLLLKASLIPLLTALGFTLFIVTATLFFFTLEPTSATNNVQKKSKLSPAPSPTRGLGLHFQPYLSLHHHTKTLKAYMSDLRRLPSTLWLSWQLLGQLGKRYWLAIASLTLALAGFTSLGILLQVQRQSLEAFVSKHPVLTERTLQIQEEYPVTLSNTTRWNMAMMPGVTFVSSYLTKVTMEEKFEEDMYVLDVNAFPYQRYLQTTDGVTSKALPEALETERNLAISDSLAKSYKLKAGMSLRLRTPSGNHRYKIVATLKDIGGVSRAMFMGRGSYLQDWGRDSQGLFVLSFEETSQRQQLEQLLQEQLAHTASLPWPIVSLKSDVEKLLGKLLAWCRWLMLLFVVVALSALAHALQGSTLRSFLSTLYLLGGQRHLLDQLTRRTVLLSTLTLTALALALGTTLSYWLISGLNESNAQWSWQLSGSSYVPSLSVLFVLVSYLVITMNKVIRLK